MKDKSHSRQLSEQEQVRRQSREALDAAGVNPYPYEWPVSDYVVPVLREFEENVLPKTAPIVTQKNQKYHGILKRHHNFSSKTISLAGRLMSRRIMGKASFFDIQDSTGRMQGYVRRDDMPERFYNEIFKRHIDIGDIIGIEGHVFRTRMGEITIHVSKLELLAKALRPLPIVKEQEGSVFNEVTEKEFRYRQRYVDLNVNPSVRDVFIQRACMVTAIRKFLDEKGYIEVETPVLQPIYGGASARPFKTHHNALDMPLYMRIADELYLKRCIVGGFEGVYEIAKDFRNEGLSRFHNPEFTMLELYVAFKDYQWMMNLVEELIGSVALTLHGRSSIQWGEEEISFERSWPRIPFFEAITQKTGHDLYQESRNKILEVADSLNIETSPSMGIGKLLDEIFSAAVEPHLIQPTFITDYPIELSPLAKKHRSQDGLVERFEMFAGGKELCNAFSELNDPDDQRSRFEEQLHLRKGGDLEAMEMDQDYLRALEYGMPPTAGLGVGIDRLAMLMTNQNSIRDVILFPLMRPDE
ncbi:MAG: lysine--tRNA ligase [Bacteroidetes bacterium]|nr:lysine--tRNA ligase [Bacteroidota bacterium]MCY4205075.1 lysine--tRNA ligase [Bacteroidota bacterium]